MVRVRADNGAGITRDFVETALHKPFIVEFAVSRQVMSGGVAAVSPQGAVNEKIPIHGNQAVAYLTISNPTQRKPVVAIRKLVNA